MTDAHCRHCGRSSMAAMLIRIRWAGTLKAWYCLPCLLKLEVRA